LIKPTIKIPTDKTNKLIAQTIMLFSCYKEVVQTAKPVATESPTDLVK
jgi:hypothetical protein